MTGNTTNLSLSEGPHTIQVRARDYEENQSNWSQIFNVVVDQSVAKVNTLSCETSLGNAAITWSPVQDQCGISGYQVALTENPNPPTPNQIIDAGNVTTYTFGQLISKKTYYAWVRAKDGSGNVSSQWNSQAFSPQSQSTGISLQNPDKISQVDQNGHPIYAVQLKVDDVDAAKYVFVRTRTDGVTENNDPTILTYDQMAANAFIYTDTNITEHASYRYTVYTENALNAQSATAIQEVTIPTIPATVTVTNYNNQPIPSFINQKTYTFKFSPAVDAEGDQLQFQVYYDNQKGDKGSTTLQPGPANVTFQTDGQYQWYVKVVVIYNNQQVYTKTTNPQTLNIDLAAPPLDTNSFVIQSTTGQTLDTGDYPTNSVNVQLANITLYDNGSGIKDIYLWNGDNTTPPTGAIHQSINETVPDSKPWTMANNIPFALTTGDGLKTVTMQVIDNAGNATLITRQVTLDTTPPVAPDINTFKHFFASNRFGHPTINFGWQASDPDIAQFQCQYSLPDGTALPVSYTSGTDKSFNAQPIDIGSCGNNQKITLTVSAIDKAGNQSTVTSYTVYTPAALGTLQDLNSGYNNQTQQFELKWQLTPGSSAQGYMLQYSSTGQDFSDDQKITSDASGIFTHTGLSPHATWYYRLVAINNSGDENFGTSFSRQVPNIAPPMPVLVPLQYASGTVKFQCSQAPDTDGDPITEHIWLQGPTDFDFKEMGTYIVLGNIQNQIYDLDTVSGLIHGQTYNWKVVADDGWGGETSSTAGQFVVDTKKPTLTVVPATFPLYTNQPQLTITAGDDSERDR